MSRVIAVANGKGGVGKTSTSVNLAVLLALAEYRVLLIDWDPQGNTAEDLGTTASSDEGAGLARAVLYGAPLEPVLGVRPNLDVCPAGTRLAEVAAAIDVRARQDRATAYLALAESLEQVADRYDVILIDCPPGEAVLQRIALSAARWVLVPTKTDASSRKGLRLLAEMFTAAREVNPSLELLGVFLFGVTVSATRVRESARVMLEADLGGVAPVLQSTIRHVEAAAVDERNRGEVAHELEQAVTDNPKWWRLRQGEKGGPVVASSSSSLAAEYQALAEEVVGLLTAAEEAEADEVDA